MLMCQSSADGRSQEGLAQDEMKTIHCIAWQTDLECVICMSPEESYVCERHPFEIDTFASYS